MFQNSFLMWTSKQLTFAVLRSMGRNPESGRLVLLVDWLVLGTLSSNPARWNLFQKMLMKIMFHHAPSQGSTGLPMPPAPAEMDSQSAIKGPSPASQAWRLIPLGSLAGARWVAVTQEEDCAQEWWRPGHAGISLPHGLPPPVMLSVAVARPLTPGLSPCGRYWEGDSSSLAPDGTTEERHEDTQMTRIQDPFKSTSSIFLLRKDYTEPLMVLWEQATPGNRTRERSEN